MLKLTAVVVLAIVTVGCSGSPSAPTPPPIANFQGVWLGTWARTSCNETGGAVGQGCAAFEGSTSGPNQFRLTVTQTASAVTGTLEIGQILVSVSGPVSASGTLTLTGQGRRGPAAYNVVNWQSTLTGGALNGRHCLRCAAALPALAVSKITASFHAILAACQSGHARKSQTRIRARRTS